MFRQLTVVIVTAVLLTAAQAQRAPGSTPSRPSIPDRVPPEPARPSDLRVQIRTLDDRPLNLRVQVEVMQGGGRGPGDTMVIGIGPVLASGVTDGSGEARLRVYGSGYFRVRVTGPELEESFSDGFIIERAGMSQNVSVRVKLKPDANAGTGAPGGIVSAAELKVPGRARKENEKGMEKAKGSQWPKAIEHFRKAIEVYPQYDMAYNNLGVVYLSSGDTAQARQAFAKAAELNPQNAKASRNLSRILLGEKNYTEAKLLLERSLAVEPTSADSLNMLATVFLQSGDYKQALAHARKVHQVPHDAFAVSHLIAARSLEHLNAPQDAVAELKTFLKESPDSPNAEQVRKALSRLEAANRPAQ